MSLQILLVDDEPAIKIGFRQLTDWSKTPYTLCGTAGNGKEALAYLEKNPVDIIITDLKMSVMDGIGLIHALKQNNSEIPIIVLSNYSDFELVREALTAGAADYILKANISRSDFSVEEFAQLMKLGRTVFYKKIRGITGYSPNEYLRIMRMKKAAELLLSEEHLTVAEVAYKVGINDPFYFSKCFKTQFGVAPSVYQRGEMKEQGDNEAAEER